MIMWSNYKGNKGGKPFKNMQARNNERYKKTLWFGDFLEENFQELFLTVMGE